MLQYAKIVLTLESIKEARAAGERDKGDASVPND